MQTGAHIRLVLWKTAKAVETVDRASIRQTGLNLTDFMILEALLHKGPMPVNTIAGKVLLTSGSMTVAINRLTEKGLVERRQDETDRRCFQVHLTPEGRELIETAYARHERNLEEMVEVLNEAEREELVRLLKKLGRHSEGLRVS